jgi:predicted XRE-type DNA-binding protein
MMKKKKPFTTGSGDVFVDLDFSEEESAGLNLKSVLFDTLQAALRSKSETQMELASKLKLPQPKISDIKNGKMSGFSIERIVNCLLRLDYEISVDAHPAAPGKRGRIVARSKTDQLVG